VLIIAAVTLAVVAGAWAVGADRSGGQPPTPTASASADAAADVEGAAPEVGGTAPEFTTFSTTGEEITLSDLRGRPVWLVFGATWCSACRAEAPDVEAVHQQYGDRLSVVGISIGESISTVDDFATRAGLTFPQVADMYTDIASRYGILGQPTHVFVDAHGVIRSITMGALSVQAATGYIEPLLDGS
jgi:peroxiredoxin